MASNTRNLARASGFEMEQLLVRFTTAGAAPASAGKARGNTVRRIERTGAGAFKLYFRAGVIPSTASIANAKAGVEAVQTAVNNIATVEAFSLNAATQEMEVTVTVRRSDTGAAVETTGSNINVTIDLELQTGSFPSVDTLN